MRRMDADTRAKVGILTARIKEISELLVDFTWKRSPQAIRRLQIERDEMMLRRQALLKRK